MSSFSDPPAGRMATLSFRPAGVRARAAGPLHHGASQRSIQRFVNRRERLVMRFASLSIIPLVRKEQSGNLTKERADGINSPEPPIIEVSDIGTDRSYWITCRIGRNEMRIKQKKDGGRGGMRSERMRLAHQHHTCSWCPSHTSTGGRRTCGRK